MFLEDSFRRTTRCMELTTKLFCVGLNDVLRIIKQLNIMIKINNLSRVDETSTLFQ
jgi:hypothetical protein